MRVFSLALLLCAISFAQDTTATVEGRVLDPSGRVITGGGPLQAPLSALPWTQARQLSAPINFTNPWNGQNPFSLDSFPQPTTVLTVENGMRPLGPVCWRTGIVSAALRAGCMKTVVARGWTHYRLGDCHGTRMER
jgi:hypothetical protein